MFFQLILWLPNFAFLVFYSQNLNNIEIILILNSKYNPNIIMREFIEYSRCPPLVPIPYLKFKICFHIVVLVIKI